MLFVVVCCRISRARGERKRKREALDLNKKRQILVRDVFSHPFDTRGSVSVLRVQSEKNNARAQPAAGGGLDRSACFFQSEAALLVEHRADPL